MSNKKRISKRKLNLKSKSIHFQRLFKEKKIWSFIFKTHNIGKYSPEEILQDWKNI